MILTRGPLVPQPAERLHLSVLMLVPQRSKLMSEQQRPEGRQQGEGVPF